ncbi:MAG TPA: hypothetical protein VFJ65_11445 [Solirubrobacterales bacterium]|nr:hypothetical protein [Solirubrobacterales bacterium]
MRPKLFSLVTSAVLAGALLLAVPASSLSGTAPLMGKGGKYARDCAGNTALVKGRPTAIRFVVWCGVQDGKVSFSLRRREGPPLRSFPHLIVPLGRGAAGDFHCRRMAATLRCTGRVDGPAVISGFVGVPRGTRCLPLPLTTARIISIGRPTGCPGTQPPRPPRVDRSMASFRREFGLDLDLKGDKSAVAQRMRNIVRAWKRGAPVERVTYQEWAVPLLPRDQTELEYRDEYLNRDAAAIERWGPRHAPSTYAGWDFDHAHGGIFYIGFLGNQEAQIAAFESQVKVLAPDRIKPFPVPPKYSEQSLRQFEEELVDLPIHSKLLSLIVGIETNSLANRVEVATQHVAIVRRLLAERFGPENPALVVFERPLVLL